MGWFPPTQNFTSPGCPALAGSTSTVAAAERGRGDRDGDDDE